MKRLLIRDELDPKLLTMRVAILLLTLTTALGAVGQPLPLPDHIVVVIMENKAYEDVIDNDSSTSAKNSRAPYLNQLARTGALLTHSYGLHHPSQPNYLELFSGSAQRVCNDHPPRAFSIDAPNLARSLGGARFVGFAEDLPADLTTPDQGDYVRRHCPWLSFAGVTRDMSRDFSTFPQTAEGFRSLPAVGIVIPNLFDDMHTTSGTSVRARFKRRLNRHDIAAEVHQGDQWLERYLGAYATWAMTNNSLLIVTWDEDSAENTSRIVRLELDRLDRDDRCEHAMNTNPPDNHIPTIVIGEHVKLGSNDQEVNHRNLLSTILALEGLPPIDTNAAPITGIWQ